MAKLSAWSRNKAQELRASVARTHFASSIVHICEEDLTSQLSLYFIYLFIYFCLTKLYYCSIFANFYCKLYNLPRLALLYTGCINLEIC